MQSWQNTTIKDKALGLGIPHLKTACSGKSIEGSDGSFKKFLPGQIPLHEPAWALTIHKSQGSEFEEVVIVLPDIDSQVLCRELLYTAVTRAREKIVLVVSEHILKLTVERKTIRYSGLADRLS